MYVPPRHSESAAYGTITLVREPTIAVIAEQSLRPEGVAELVRWLREYRPECVPAGAEAALNAVFPHKLRDTGAKIGRALTDNELLAELAGRNCYHSYGLKAGRKENGEYLANMLAREIPHASVAYHAKMTFFIAGISRRVSHELIRHYVGADRDEEGSPSQESTRYTLHPGHFAVPPKISEDGMENFFAEAMEQAYGTYKEYIAKAVQQCAAERGDEPKGADRKRIHEAGAGLLPMQACTSFMWTTNAVALAKLLKERANAGADREFQRLAYKWRRIALDRWPNLMVPLLKGSAQ